MAIYGYIRKQTPSNTVMQLHNLMAFDCDDIFIEEETLDNHKELEKLLLQLNNEDVLVVENISSFGKVANELNDLFNSLFNKSVRLISREDALDSDNTYSFYQLLQVMTSINKECSSRMMKERIAVSREKGLRFGRPPLDEAKIDEIKQLYHHDKLSMRDIVSKCQVSLGTVHKYVTNETSMIN